MERIGPQHGPLGTDPAELLLGEETTRRDSSE